MKRRALHRGFMGGRCPGIAGLVCEAVAAAGTVGGFMIGDILGYPVMGGIAGFAVGLVAAGWTYRRIGPPPP